MRTLTEKATKVRELASDITLNKRWKQELLTTKGTVR